MAEHAPKWNGKSAEARKVRVVVANHKRFPNPWFRHLIGEERDAVEVRQQGHVFYLDDEDPPGRGWVKVTRMQGSSLVGHRSLDVDDVIAER